MTIVERATALLSPFSHHAMSTSLLRQRSCRLAPSFFGLAPIQHRQQSTTTKRPLPQSAPNARFLSDTKSRIGKCLTFGLPEELLPKASSILSTLSTDWRSLTIGTEGYLADPYHAGLYRHPIVWGEQDSMGHVNNVMYVRYAESGRTNWTRNLGKYFDPAHKAQWDEMLTSKAVGLILKSITVDFKFPMTWPDRITVCHKLRSRPDASTESMVLDVVILSERMQRPAARCLEDVVVYDYKVGRKSGMPEFMLDQFKQIWQLQEKEKAASSKKVEQLLTEVRELEKGSWDREGAVEQ